MAFSAIYAGVKWIRLFLDALNFYMELDAASVLNTSLDQPFKGECLDWVEVISGCKGPNIFHGSLCDPFLLS